MGEQCQGPYAQLPAVPSVGEMETPGHRAGKLEIVAANGEREKREQH